MFPEPPSQQTVDRHAEKLAYQVMERQIDPGFGEEMPRHDRVHAVVDRLKVEGVHAQHSQGQVLSGRRHDLGLGLVALSSKRRGLPEAPASLVGLEPEDYILGALLKGSRNPVKPLEREVHGDHLDSLERGHAGLSL